MSINLETHTLEMEKTQVGNDSGGKVDTQKQQHRQVTDSNKVWGDCGSNDQWGKCGSGKERGDERKLEVMGWNMEGWGV